MCCVAAPHQRGEVEVHDSLHTPPFEGADTHTCLHTPGEVRACAGGPEWMTGENGVQGYILMGCCAF